MLENVCLHQLNSCTNRNKAQMHGADLRLALVQPFFPISNVDLNYQHDIEVRYLDKWTNMISQAFFPVRHLKNERKGFSLEGMRYLHFPLA